MLGLGRLVFMPWHRASLKASEGKSAPDASFVNATSDPAGFTLVEVLGYGALGHALGYAALAISSLPGVHGPTNL